MSDTMNNPQVSAQINASLSGGAAPATASSNIAHNVANALVVGASAGQVNKAYSSPFTVSNGSPLVLDLNTGLTDPLGNALVFTKVAAILISNDSTTTGEDFTLGGGTNPLFTTAPNIVAAKGGAYLIVNPVAQITVDSTHKTIQIAVAAGTNVPGKITVIGQ
jgi:hypothetical protein